MNFSKKNHSLSRFLGKYHKADRGFVGKKLIAITISLIALTMFTQCSSAQFDKNAPFTIGKASHQEWVGGRPGSKGTLVTLELGIPSKEITFDSIFFKKKKLKLEAVSSENKLTLTANFVVTIVSDKNIIMHSDRKKEMVNKVPELVLNFPFELADNECVISYFVKEKKHYFKVENLKKEKTLFYQ